MRASEIRSDLLLLVGVFLAAPMPGSLPAQQAAAPATASFQGKIVSDVDRRPVRAADLRVTRIDSVHVTPGKTDGDGFEVFADSTKPRFASTDSTGAYAIHELTPGRYLVRVRRMGYEPFQAVLAVDSATVHATFVMRQVSQLLATVVVTENAVDKVTQALIRSGFAWRSRAEPTGQFVTRGEILTRQASTVGDLLAYYGIRYDDPNEFHLDYMPVDYEYLSTYPSDLVIGIEIYKHGRPIEYNGTRPSSVPISSYGDRTITQSVSGSNHNALVIVWTYR